MRKSPVLILISLSLSLLWPESSLAQGSGLVVSLPLDEGDGTTAADVSGNGNDGVLNGPQWTTGKWNGALSFDGLDDVLEIANSPTISSMTTGVTVAAWVYRAANQGKAVAVMGRQLGTTWWDHWIFGFNAKGQYLWIVNTSTAGYSNKTLGGVAPLGQWVYVTGTYDGSMVRFYVNGVQQFSTPHTGRFPVDTTGVTIGAGSNDAAHTPVEVFNGKVDGVRVYSRALTSQEVVQLYQSGGGSVVDAPPTVFMTSPVSGALKGTILAQATANDDIQVLGVQFAVDGSNAGPEDTVQPYSTQIDTTQYAEGQHTLSAVARDAAGNVVVSPPVTVIFDNVAVMPLGDSITAGYISEGNSHNLDGGYRRDLWEELRAAGITDINFVGSQQSGTATMDRDHEGHGGWTINQIAGSVGTWLPAFSPDIILLLIGTNDFSAGASTASQALTRLASLLDTIHSLRPSAKILLANEPGVLPTNIYGISAQAILDYNAGMPALVSARAAQGWKIELVDLHDLSGIDRNPGSPDYSPDGLHPSVNGYAKIADVWFAAVDPSLSTDTTPPSTPTGLSAIATSSGAISLSWNPSTDDLAGVAVYRVYRNAVAVGTTTSTSFVDTSVTPNTTYFYAVTALDWRGNESGPSGSISVTTLASGIDITPPSVPTGLTATGVSASSIALAWTGSIDPGAGTLVTDTFDRANGGLGSAWTAVNGTFQIVSEHVEPAASNAFTLARLTTWAGTGDQWAEVTMTVAGLESGGGPVVRLGNGGANLYLVDYNGRADHKLYRRLNGSYVVLGGWTDAANPGDVVRLEATGTTIRVRVNGIAKVTVTNAEVSGGVPGVYAFVASGQQVQLDTFAATTSGGASGVAGYRVYRNGTAVTTTTGTTYTNTGLAANTSYSYAVTAYDGAGNESGPSGSISVTTLASGIDITPPSVPTGLTATGVSASSIALAWTGSIDPGAGALVTDTFDRANGGLGSAWTAVNGTFQIVSKHVEPAASNAFTLARLTTWAGTGDQWAEVTMTVAGLESGGGPVVRLGNGGANLYLVDYNGRADHKLYRRLNGSYVVLGGWTDAANPGDVVRLEATGTTIRVRVNGIAKVTVTNAEVSGGVPGVYAFVASGQQVQLDTFAATTSGGASGVAGYRVYRNGTAVTTTTGTTYTNTGLAANTSYSYAVTAYDGAGNESGPSASISVTTGAGALVTDTFDRANGGLGSAWTAVNGTFQIVSEHVEPAASNAFTLARLTTWAGTGDQWAEVTMTVAGLESGGGPVVRLGNGGANLYLVDYNGRADHKLYRRLNGSYVVLGGWTDAANPGDVVRLEATGTTIRVRVNGIAKVTVTNAEVSGGVPGVYAFVASGQQVQLDTFAATSP